jgi:hypothetical protein
LRWTVHQLEAILNGSKYTNNYMSPDSIQTNIILGGKAGCAVLP